MSLQIRSLILYNKAGEIRKLPFQLGKVNIITGKSKTGKSAILEIVEFCLGRSDFRIPEGVIRKTVAWYGLLLQSGDSQIFIAKPAPDGNNYSQSQVYLEVVNQIDIPPMARLTPNTNDDGLVKFLGQCAGIVENIQIPPEGDSRDPLEVNFKHARLFSFQRQTEIANDSLLFHRQAEPFMPQTIRDVLPYFLGAVPEDQLLLERKLRQAKRELKLLQKKLKEAELLSGSGTSQAYSLLAECKQVGLIEENFNSNSVTEILDRLQSVLSWEPSSYTPVNNDQIVVLQQEREQLLKEFTDLSERIKAAQSFVGDTDGYSHELDQQRLRLSSIGLYSEIEDPDICPLCSSRVPYLTPTIAEMRASLERLTLSLKSVEDKRPKLVEYITGLEEQRDAVRQKIEVNTAALNAVMKAQEQAQLLQDANSRTAKVVGRVSLFMENIIFVDDHSELNQSIVEAQQEVNRLEALLDRSNVDERMESILNRIGRQMTEWAERLELEHNNVPYRLDLKKLTVVADQEDRPIPMERMGSGENWLGCHLIAHLALHQYFIRKKRPVLNVLMLDQPTQVYFPPDVYSSMQGDVKELTDEDRVAVKRLFDLLFEVVERLYPDLQIIVTDHANLDDEKFQQSLVEEPWRNGNALIPQAWLS